MSRRRVLHVIESYGGGSATALTQYVRSTPEVSHHLVRRLRADSYASNDEEALFDSVRDLAPGVVRAIGSLRRVVRDLRPDVVHAHSSFAGAFVRLGVWGDPLVVYTPHGYSIERLDVPGSRRAMFRAAELALGRNTDVYAGCSARETDLSRRLAPSRRHVTVPNIARVTASDFPRSRPDPDAAPMVTGMGRMGAQHDPWFFLDVVRRMREQRADLAATWIGGGEPDAEAELRRADVTVTGWLPQVSAFELLSRASVYVHSAAWDGAPMALLEASALGTPIVARRSAALDDAPAAFVNGAADGVARAALGLLVPASADANVAAWRGAFAHNTPQAQHDRLMSIYGPSAGT